jgi:hypothetical protein
MYITVIKVTKDIIHIIFSMKITEMMAITDNNVIADSPYTAGLDSKLSEQSDHDKTRT